MATPPRNGSDEPRRRNAANGKFWIGKSAPAAFAEEIQLMALAS
jgi:hypothetical protein